MPARWVAEKLFQSASKLTNGALTIGETRGAQITPRKRFTVGFGEICFILYSRSPKQRCSDPIREGAVCRHSNTKCPLWVESGPYAPQ